MAGRGHFRVAQGSCLKCATALVVFEWEAAATIDELGGLNSGNIALADVARVDPHKRHVYVLAKRKGHFECPACGARNVFRGNNAH